MWGDMQYGAGMRGWGKGGGKSCNRAGGAPRPALTQNRNCRPRVNPVLLPAAAGYRCWRASRHGSPCHAARGCIRYAAAGDDRPRGLIRRMSEVHHHPAPTGDDRPCGLIRRSSYSNRTGQVLPHRAASGRVSCTKRARSEGAIGQYPRSVQLADTLQGMQKSVQAWSRGARICR